MLALTLAAALAVSASVLGMETADNGHELLDDCATAVALMDGRLPEPRAEDRLRAGYCIGFVQGLTQIVAVSYHLKPQGGLFCPPENDTIHLDDAVRALVAYLKRHPERLHARKVTLAAAAFIGAYPCPLPDGTRLEPLP